MRSIRNKILVVAVASVAVATLAMLVVLFVGKRRVGKTLRMEVSRSSKSETGKLARAVRLMAQAADRILHKELRAAADGVAAHLSTVLAPKQILLPEGTQRTQLTDLSSQQRGLVELTARETDTKIIIYRAVGGALRPVYRSSGKLRCSKGALAGTTHLATAAKGKTFVGRVGHAVRFCFAAAAPVYDASKHLLGVVELRRGPEAIASLSKAIQEVTVGASGYVFVIGGNGAHRGHYLVSKGGSRDGENIWNAKDSDGRLFIQTIVHKGVASSKGALSYVRYPWKNKGETTSRDKVSAIVYYKPFDWVIGAGAYEDDFDTVREPIEGELGDMLLFGSLIAALIFVFVGVGAFLFARSISAPILQMARTAEALAEGDLSQDVNVTAQDEIGQLASTLQTMIEAQRQVVAASKAIAAGDTSVSLEARSSRDTLVLSLLDMAATLRDVMASTRSMVAALKRGDLSHRADETRFDGTFRQLVAEINTLGNVVAEPIRITADYVERISKGDIPDALNANFEGEFDRIKVSLNRCVRVVEELVSDMRALSRAGIEGRLDYRADVGRHQGRFAEILAGVNETLDAVISPVKEAEKTLLSLAEGDLTARVGGTFNGDHAAIKTYVNKTASALEGAMAQVAATAAQVADASKQIAATSQAVAAGASQQAASLEETSSGLEEMAATTQQAAEQAAVAQRAAKDASAAVDDGSRSMQQMSTAMQDITEAAASTSAIIRDINEIAFQTNLLALNAAVEAARAGEAGRGFAVVAEEVRNLATRAKQAAQHTEALIQQSIQLAANGSTLSEDVTRVLVTITSRVTDVSRVMDELATASQEQSRGIKQLNHAVSAMDQVTQHNAASAEEASSSAQELSSQSDELDRLVHQFRIGQHSGHVLGTGKPSANGAAGGNGSHPQAMLGTGNDDFFLILHEG